MAIARSESNGPFVLVLILRLLLTPGFQWPHDPIARWPDVLIGPPRVFSKVVVRGSRQPEESQDSLRLWTVPYFFPLNAPCISSGENPSGTVFQQA